MSSSARVVSFFSRVEERTREFSLSTRAYFAATRTARYLLAANLAASTGVKTCMRSLLWLNGRDLLPQPFGQHCHALVQSAHPRPLQHLRIHDRRDAGDRSVQVVVDDHIIILVYRLQLIQRRSDPSSQRAGVLRFSRVEPPQQHIG